jgi:hypothetical protein
MFPLERVTPQAENCQNALTVECLCWLFLNIPIKRNLELGCLKAIEAVLHSS